MKQHFSIFFLLINLNLFAQQRDTAVPIYIGFQAVYFTQPGIQIGTVFNLKEWNFDKEGKPKFRTLYVSPRIGVFIRPGNHTSAASDK